MCHYVAPADGITQGLAYVLRSMLPAIPVVGGLQDEGVLVIGWRCQYQPVSLVYVLAVAAFSI